MVKDKMVKQTAVLEFSFINRFRVQQFT